MLRATSRMSSRRCSTCPARKVCRNANGAHRALPRAVVGTVVTGRAATPFAKAEATLLNKHACTDGAAIWMHNAIAVPVRAPRRHVVGLTGRTSRLQHTEDAA